MGLEGGDWMWALGEAVPAYLPAPLGWAKAHLGDGKGSVSSRPCAGMGVGPGLSSRSRAGVIRVKQRGSAPNSKACSCAVLRGVPEGKAPGCQELGSRAAAGAHSLFPQPTVLAVPQG